MGLVRFLLATSVLIGHAFPLFGVKFVGGMTAVESFFIISGFYMAFVLHEKYDRIKHPYRAFLTNRFLRLFPMYWVVLGIILIFPIQCTSHTSSSSIFFINTERKRFRSRHNLALPCSPLL